MKDIVVLAPIPGSKPSTPLGGFRAAARLQNGLIAPAERRVLEWMARRTPNWIKPDHLTLLGFAGMALAGASYAGARWWPPFLLLVNIFLVINWFGDSMDGTLARVRNKQRPRYGFYVDHMVDAFGSVFLTCGLALSGYATPMVAILLLVAFSLLSINVYLATYTIGTFQLSFFKFSPTELRILLAIGNMVAFVKPTIRFLGERQLFFDVSSIIAGSIMVILLLISVAKNTVILYRAERV